MPPVVIAASVPSQLAAGAGRLIGDLPVDPPDRLLVPGINEAAPLTA
jgi:hypothetical protein